MFFPEDFKIFPNSGLSMFSLGVSVCTHTRQVEHQQCSRNGRVQNYHKILRKKTQALMNTTYNRKGKVLFRLWNMKVCHQSAVYEFSLCVFFARRKSIWQYSHLIWWIWLKAFKGFNKVNTYFKLKILRFTISIFPSPILYCQEVCITKIRVPCLKPCCFNCFPFFYI